MTTEQEQYAVEMKSRLARADAPVRRALLESCEGDLTRLTGDVRSGFTVHNRPVVGAPAFKPRKIVRLADRLAAPVAPPAPKPAPPPKKIAKKAPVPAPPKKRQPRTTVDIEALAALVNFGQVEITTPAPGVKVVKAPPRPRTVDTLTSPMPDDEVIQNFDWDSVNLDATAARLRDLMKGGVPDAIRYSYSGDVLALYGMDLSLMDAALRSPERVEIRPESFDQSKRYPVLGFYRGDISVILGLRQPLTPKVIAAYATSRLEHDTHRVGHTGGGGSKNGEKGLPTNPRQVANKLRARGAQVEINPLTEGDPVEVFYQGKSVGKISTGPASKETCASDYQRALRRIVAMDSKV